MGVPSLNHLALSALPTETWHSLDKHLQRCLYPTNLAQAVTLLQRRILLRRRVRMTAFLQLLDDQARNSLAPVTTVRHSASAAHEVLLHGDHVVVMWWFGIAHHGIVIRPHRGGPIQIADFSSPTDDWLKRDAMLRITDYTEFLRGHLQFGIVLYVEENLHRERAVQIATLMVQTPRLSLLEYSLLKWNCECFAMISKTGGIDATSQQLLDSFRAIEADMRTGDFQVFANLVRAMARAAGFRIRP